MAVPSAAFAIRLPARAAGRIRHWLCGDSIPPAFLAPESQLPLRQGRAAAAGARRAQYAEAPSRASRKAFRMSALRVAPGAGSTGP